jgi:Kelch motif
MIVFLLACITFFPRFAQSIGAWVQMQNMPISRSDHTAVNLIGKNSSLILISGGCDGAQVCDSVLGFCACTAITADQIVFNITSNSFTRVIPMPIKRYRHNACPWRDNIYFFGGRDLSDNMIMQIDVLNTTSMAFSTLNVVMPSDIGSDNSCSTVGDLIYTFGGYSSDYSLAFNSTYAFDPIRLTWTRKRAPMIVPRGDFSSVTVGTSIYVYGGYRADQGPDTFCTPLRATEMYNTLTDSWSTYASLPFPLAAKDDGLYVNGRVYSIGGESKAKSIGCNDLDIVPIQSVLSYNPVNNTWANETSMTDGRMRFASASATTTSNIFVFGGQGAIFDNEALPLLYSSYQYVINGLPSPSPSPAVVQPSSSVPAGWYSSGTLAGAIIGTILLLLALLGLGYWVMYGCKCGRRSNPMKPIVPTRRLSRPSVTAISGDV